MTDGALQPLAQCDSATRADPTPRTPKVLPLTRPVGIEEDRATIRQFAKRISMLTERCNAAATLIAIGGEFAALKATLTKNSPHDQTRLGWCRAFEKEENQFGMQRRMAEDHIAIHTAFFHVGNTLPARQLPQSFRPLVVLARLLIREANALEVEQLQKWIKDGLIRPTSTEDEVRALAKQHELIDPGKKTAPPGPATEMLTATPSATLDNVLQAYSRLSQAEQKTFLKKIGCAAPVGSANLPLSEVSWALREIEFVMTNMSAPNWEEALTRIQELRAQVDPKPTLPGRSPHWLDRMNKAASRH